MALLGVIRDGEFITAERLADYVTAPYPLRASYPTPQLSPDYKPYRSPVGEHRLIDGRRERREDLARHNCRPVEKGEGLGGVYHNEEFCRKNGLPWTPPPAPKPLDYEPAPFVREAVRSKRRG